jgi:hypothetical protein
MPMWTRIVRLTAAAEISPEGTPACHPRVEVANRRCRADPYRSVMLRVARLHFVRRYASGCDVHHAKRVFAANCASTGSSTEVSHAACQVCKHPPLDDRGSDQAIAGGLRTRRQRQDQDHGRTRIHRGASQVENVRLGRRLYGHCASRFHRDALPACANALDPRRLRAPEEDSTKSHTQSGRPARQLRIEASYPL